MSSAGPPLTDQQVEAVLNALTRPIYIWRMATGRRASEAARRARATAIQEARAILQDPVNGPQRAYEQARARATKENR